MDSVHRRQTRGAGRRDVDVRGPQMYRPSSGEMQWLTMNGDRRTTCKDGCEKARTVGLGDYVGLDTDQDHDLRVKNPDAR